MNLHRDAYLAGAPHYVTTLYRKGGKQVPVFDRSKRRARIVKAMHRAGQPALHIALRLGVSTATVNRLLLSAFPYRSDFWIISNFPVAPQKFPL